MSSSQRAIGDPSGPYDEIAAIFVKLRADIAGKTGAALDVALDTAQLHVRSVFMRATSSRHGGDIVTTKRGKA